MARGGSRAPVSATLGLRGEALPESTAVVAILSLVVVGFAVFFTNRFNSKDTWPWKVIKFLGILVSTMPIIGLIQGAIVGSRAPGYSQACYWQAGVGAIAYLLSKYAFKLVS